MSSVEVRNQVLDAGSVDMLSRLIKLSILRCLRQVFGIDNALLPCRVLISVPLKDWMEPCEGQRVAQERRMRFNAKLSKKGA